MSRRTQALALIREYVPSTYGDPKFAEILNGSWAPGYGTTCGYLTSWLLWRLGCIDRVLVNRADVERGLTYRSGQNMAAIVTGGKRLGAWRTTGRPRPGDIYHVHIDPPIVRPDGSLDYRDHVGVVLRDDGGTWHTADAGQGVGRAQSALYRDRVVIPGPRLRLQFSEPRYVGWLDLDAIPLDGEPPLPLPDADEEPPGVAGLIAGAAIAATVGAIVWGLS